MPQGYTSGGAGYILSRAGLKLIAEGMLRNETGCEAAYESEDYRLGKFVVSLRRFDEKKNLRLQNFFKNFQSTLIARREGEK
ncbi:unnamed protein product [Dibothriocephalus latus]|uniref:Uncharacterized protein n=1 Tax=Dibothriocephalus latus TaxID=60516 RepID=A0A3P7P7S1_DIBLA|nr:unnamed protein product [Dibothriocephalus latus]